MRRIPLHFARRPSPRHPRGPRPRPDGFYTHGQSASDLLAARATAAARLADIRILNPTQEAFADFQEQTRDNTGRWVIAIPVDHLGHRKTSLGTQSGLNLQDATLLKIQITYYHPLIIPFVDRLFAAASPAGQIAAALGHPVLPLSAEATQRMQSPFLAANALSNRADLSKPQPANGQPPTDLTPLPPENLPEFPPNNEPPLACGAGGGASGGNARPGSGSSQP